MVTDPKSSVENVMVSALPASVTVAGDVSPPDVNSPVRSSPEPEIVNVPVWAPPGVATSNAHVPTAWTTASGSAPSGPPALTS